MLKNKILVIILLSLGTTYLLDSSCSSPKMESESLNSEVNGVCDDVTYSIKGEKGVIKYLEDTISVLQKIGIYYLTIETSDNGGCIAVFTDNFSPVLRIDMSINEGGGEFKTDRIVSYLKDLKLSEILLVLSQLSIKNSVQVEEIKMIIEQKTKGIYQQINFAENNKCLAINMMLLDKTFLLRSSTYKGNFINGGKWEEIEFESSILRTLRRRNLR